MTSSEARSVYHHALRNGPISAHVFGEILSPACYDVMRPHLVVRQHKCPTLYQNTPGDMVATLLLRVFIVFMHEDYTYAMYQCP